MWHPRLQLPLASAGVLVATSLAVVGLSADLLSAQATNRYGNPRTLKPAPTSAAITARDLQIRLYQFADDSMQGRQVGRVGNKKGTDYIAAEVKRLGLIPAGNNGTYFQNLPYHIRKYTDHSHLTVDGNPLTWNTDFVAVPGQRAPRAINNATVVFGGTKGDTATQISAAEAAGKFVVLLAEKPKPPAPGSRFMFSREPDRFADAAAVAVVDLDPLTPAQRKAINEPAVASQAGGGRGGFRGAPGGGGAPVDSVALLKQQLAALQPAAAIRLTSAAAARLFNGQTVESLSKGAKGGSVTASLDFVELPTEWGRNVVAILPGSDPKLKHQYVAIGAHNDHVGFRSPVDKDSLKAFNDERIKLQIASGMTRLTPAQLAGIKVNMDSIRRVHPRPRIDSINNGADDDGSGSMAVLEIAEALAKAPVKPKRSILFVWHTGEEAGLVGSQYYVHNPTVPIDSIAAAINIDMIGRGRAEDLPGGGPDYLAVVGSWFDSKDLGEQVKAVNAKQSKPLRLDYQFDETTQWDGYNNIYGRSDHYNYAQQGIPIAFFFTGLHGDYHQASDEPEFIDYPHYAHITNYIRDLMVDVANGPRPRLNGTKPAKQKNIQP